MTKLIALAFAVATFTTAAIAEDCAMEDAEAKLITAMDAGIVTGVGMVNRHPTIAVDAGTWQQMDFNTRLGMVATFECAFAGPGQIARTIRVTDAGGKVLAKFDGIERHLEIIE